MKVLSLFDGISCGQVALERARIPVEVYYASEIDKYAIEITQKNYPATIQLGDVTKIDFTQFIGKVDLIMGGSPCQDLSIAGKRAGLQGERSGLFYKFVEAIEVIKPKYFLLENNFGMPKEAYEEISRLMGCYPIMINSALVSAQTRKRFYWTNIGPQDYDLFGFPTVAIPQPENKGILLKDVLESGYAPDNKSRCIQSSIGRTTEREYFKKNQGQMVAEPVCVNIPETVTVRKYEVDTKNLKKVLREHKNLTNKEIAEKLNQPITKVEHWFRTDNSFAIPDAEIWLQLKAFLNIQTDEFDKSIMEFETKEGSYDKATRKYSVNGEMSTLMASGNDEILEPLRLGQIGKGGQGQRIYSDRGKSVSLSANGGGPGAKTGLYKIDLPDGEYLIRKLTPIECERLQTLPEVKNYVIIDFEEESISWFPDRQNINAQFVEKKCHKLQKLVGNAEKLDLNEFVQFVEKNLNTKSQQTKEPVALNVRINCEGLSKAKDFQEKSKKSVNIAEKNLKFLLQKIMQDFALTIVGQNLIQKNETIFGREELLPNEKNFVLVSCGKKELSKFGKEIMQLVKDVENDTLTTKKLMKFTTLYPFQKKNIEQNLIIFYYFVQLVISGFTQKLIKNKIILEIYNGYTKYGLTTTDEVVDISATQRYKAIGNGWTVDVIAHIFSFLGGECGKQ